MSKTVIIEYEFLDGPNNAKLKDKAFREKLYETTVKAVCEYEGVRYVAPGTVASATYRNEKYRLSTGTFVCKADAEIAAARLRKDYGWIVYVNEA